MNNTRFATVIHILTLLDQNPGVWLTSDWMAGSINVNPVIVRKELSVLQEEGLVITRKGKEGGSMLQRSGQDILLVDIYKLVKNADVLGKRNRHTNPKCPVGKEINNKLATLFDETDKAVFASLAGKTLAEFSMQFV
ncbi:Rrf2 family transcriptional regulator [Sphingobacterium oryzagri]|uniref:Rrf2 family transcriptional regulator n=1 Tax=Sphingobacterium oryzagri TaxID=3025669 RepID=A0ABY7WCT9_9SPHI|nr:Rrf2 family transcriptional regulator [Sphingobacterium sp. KACC 22765]WDF67473.1 Rrf2 family transcriptional regulator [Sphingobacterium sp. KACC 22765]